MKYQQPSFTLAVSSKKVTQEEWDRIFGPTQADIRKAVKKLREISVEPLKKELTGPALRTSKKS